LSAEECQRRQAALRRNLQLLLMPAIPAPRARLFDTGLPGPPPVHELLAAAESALQNTGELPQAEKSFRALAAIVQKRFEEMTEVNRIADLVDLYGATATKLGQLQERQLSLREKTDDAAADKSDSTYLGDLQQKLLEDFTGVATELTEKSVELAPRQEIAVLLKNGSDNVVRAMTDAGAALRANNPQGAVTNQQAAVAAMKGIVSLLTNDVIRVSALGKVIRDAGTAFAPVPYVTEIESEQRDLIAATRKAQPAEFAALVTPQKNLVQAVNAVLSVLDPLAHKVQSGTGMMFAKTDMESAAAALAAKDVNEAIDAQTAVADSMHDLQSRLQAVTPQYTYILEITEFVHDILPEAASLRAAQGKLRGKSAATPGEQRALESRAKKFGDFLYKATGQERFQSAAKFMGEAAGRLEAGDQAAAAPLMQQAEEALSAATTELQNLIKLLSITLDPSAYGPTPEYTLLQDVLAVAGQLRELGLQTPTDATELRAFEKRFDDFIQRSQSHPKLVKAKQYLTAARLQQAGEPLRHFIIEYITKYVRVPPPPASSDAPADPVEVVEGDISIFMPGAVSGKMPKTSRVEWEVLGRRERAALNENFARELPLEYRAILKDYYERLTR